MQATRPGCEHRVVRASTRRPQVVAHRGASSMAPEHTLEAYELAIADGADAVECDVRLTRDGVLVCVHDRKVNRTSSGRGVVSTLELADLAQLDFAAGHRRRVDPLLTAGWEEPDLDRHGVLTLERLLEVVTGCGRPVQVAIETKHPTRYAGLVEMRLTELLRRLDLHRPDGEGWSAVRVMSFASSSLRRVHVLAPDLPTVLLMRRVPVRHRDGSLPPRTAIAGPSLTALRLQPRFVERAQALGHRVHVWTVNEPADVEFVAELGVDAIITDRPAQVLRQLDR